MTSWEDVCKAERGKVFVDKYDEGLRFLIMRGGASVCAYVGVPKDHPLAGFNYEWLPVQAHGGLTYGAEGDGKYFPAGFFWYGWDYAHCGDRSTYDDDPRISSAFADSDYKNDDVRWTPDLVEKDCWSTLYDFRNLMKLAEGVASKTIKSVRQPIKDAVKEVIERAR